MNRQNLKFSIAIPAFKSKFLAECISSILEQTFINFELIILNDCSPQPIDEIVKEFSDERIFYFKNDKNVGAEHIVDNWNKCLDKATGEFFVMMGDDDKMAPNYLEEFLTLISKYDDLDVFHCRSVVINDIGESKGLTVSWPEYETVYENMHHRIKNIRQQYISDFVYRTSALKNNGGFFKLPLAWASDDISSYIAMSKKGIAHTQNPVFYYRENTMNISTTGNRQLKMDAILLEYNWLVQFVENSKCVQLNQIDTVFLNNLPVEILKNIQKKKIRTIALGIRDGKILDIFQWFPLRKKYSLHFIELFYAFLEGLKLRFVSKKYK
ncbi:glycosyltransferase family 2 protein [Flavobacterium sp. MC2016-06]|jgi:glycosyltransferase involved in cell wall biosynthesis|uniref:glycosyltransferase family 2 protein n=1 Tax=Flavobacterium sp. MC2016-06 TaxID=2676308 RepID=UPI0012BAE3B9|nr:glycosyltransferase family 2 protein [Flavobacterium sp. MC2016-06]MBU3862050.1 glycosyltransferase [Flavobacterium sp. MC2016-06]